MKIVLVAAVAENGVIGAEGGMPWHYPEDLEHFKETTMGSPVVMGRRTYESIEQDLGGPLPGRTNVVLSRSESLELSEGAVHARSVDDALEKVVEAIETSASVDTSDSNRETDDGNDETDSRDETVYVIGGETIYEQFFDRADELLVTEIPEAPSGDTYFPEITDEWIEVDRELGNDVSFVRYRRRDENIG